MNNCKLRSETFKDIISRYVEKVPFCIELYTLYLTFLTSNGNIFKKTDTIIIDIDIPATKTDMKIF